MAGTVQGDQICNLPAGSIDMTGIAPGMLASNSSTSVQVVPVGAGLDASSGTLVCTVTGNVQADWTGSGLAAILNKPTIPTNTNQLTNGAAFITSATAPVTSVNGLTGAVTIATPATPSFAQGVSHTFVTATNQTGFQVSSTRPALVHYTATVGTTATIGGASAGMIYFETAATNSVTPSDWTIVSQMGNSQTITLAVTLQSAQTVTETLAGMIPAGYFGRLRTNPVSGGPTFTYVTGQEVLL